MHKWCIMRVHDFNYIVCTRLTGDRFYLVSRQQCCIFCCFFPCIYLQIPCDYVLCCCCFLGLSNISIFAAALSPKTFWINIWVFLVILFWNEISFIFSSFARNLTKNCLANQIGWLAWHLFCELFASWSHTYSELVSKHSFIIIKPYTMCTNIQMRKCLLKFARVTIQILLNRLLLLQQRHFRVAGGVTIK